MVEFIKTCDQYPCQFRQFFQFHSPFLPLSVQEKISSENAGREEWEIHVCLRDNDGGDFAFALKVLMTVF